MNMLDYCKWRGDLSFSQDPFNEVDNLLFSQISYIEYSELVPSEKSLTIKEASDLFFSKHTIEEVKQEKTFYGRSPLALKAMAETRRFSDCRIYNFISILHKKSSEQFAAIMVDLPDKSTVISFRGTDNTMIGWKEDLMLSYKDIVSQEDALRYVNRHCNMFGRYRIVGHSKGGNLALYAAMHCKKSIRSRIIQIISNDGPGLRYDSYQMEDFALIKDRYYLYVPVYDVIGTIYEMAENKKSIVSSARGLIAPHDLLTWQVEGNHIIAAEKDDDMELARRFVSDLLKETTPKQRKVFIDELFFHINEAGITTLNQLSSGGLPVLIASLRKLSEMNSQAKETVSSMIRILTRNVGNDLQKKAKEIPDSISNVVEDIRGFRNRKTDKESGIG